MSVKKREGTRPDTRSIPVAYGWVGAEMRVFTFSNLITTDQQTDGPTDKASCNVASPQEKKREDM